MSTRQYHPISGSSCIAPTYAADLDVLPPLIAAVRADVKSLTTGLSDVQFNWKPTPARWSIAQCIKHLMLTGTGGANGQQTAIARLRERGQLSDGPYAYRGIPAMMGNMLMGSIEPPVQRKFKTAKRVIPADHHDLGALVPEFLALQDRFERLIKDAKGVDLGRASVPLGVPLFSMRLGQNLAFEIAHERRHLWQARQVRLEPGFPAA